jgi:hypothetical protein
MAAACLFAVSLASGKEVSPPQMTTLDTMAKFTRADGSVEYKHMDFGQFKELQAQYERWAALFPQALGLAKKDWDAAGTHEGTPFPADRLSPWKLDLVDRLGPSNRVKPTRSTRTGGVYIAQHTAEHTYLVPKKWESLLNQNFDVKEPKTAIEKKTIADAKEAARMVMDRIRMLDDRTKSGNTDTPNAKPGAKGDQAKPLQRPTPKR